MIKKILSSVLAVFFVVSQSYAATTGGLPSRPRFQSVGINTAPPASAGDFAISGSMTGGTVPVARVSGLAASATTDATNATNISSGSLADARLSANVPLLNATSNTFTNNNTNNTSLFVVNPNTGTAAFAYFGVTNSTNTLLMLHTSTGYSGAYLSGGLSGQSANIYTNSATPINVGTSAVTRMAIAGDGSSINLKATAVQINGVSAATCSLFLSMTGASNGGMTGGTCPFTGTSSSHPGTGQYTYTYNTGLVNTNSVLTCNLQSAGVVNMIWRLNGTMGTTSFTIVTTNAATGADADVTVAMKCIVYL